MTLRRWIVAFGLVAGSAASLAAQQLAVTRVRLDSLGVLTQLARQGFEVAGITRVAGEDYALVVTTALGRARLGAAGLSVRVGPPVPAAPPVWFRDFPRVQVTLEGLAAAGRITLDTIGLSWEGRPLLAAKIGTAPDAAERPNVLFLGAHHAREWISSEMALRLVEYLSTSPSEATLLAARDVWVIPVANPDGFQYTFDVERLWRKNRRPNGDGSVGVDLNRNYPAFWGQDDVGSSAQPDVETYRGPSAASEPEVQAIMAFHDAHPPVVALSYHSFSDLVLYPYGHQAGLLPPDLGRFTQLAGTPADPAVLDRLPESTRPAYYPGPSWQLYPTNGDYTEWAYRAHGTLAVTVELTAGCCVGGADYGFVFPDDSLAIATVFADNFPLAISAIEMAAAPALPSPAAAFETLWPEIRLVGPPGAPARTATTSGLSTTPVELMADSLDQGALEWRWVGTLPTAAVGTTVEDAGSGARAELVYSDGAEETSGWTGASRDTTSSLEGRWHWLIQTDTLRSPEISLAGVRSPRLAMWVRHAGSLFQPDHEAVVEVSTDGGEVWSVLARIAGSGEVWYPVIADLPVATRLRMRVSTRDLPIELDAVQIFGTPVGPVASVPAGELGVSENPVRSTRVFFTWPASSGDARLSVFTFNGQVVYRTTLSAAAGQVAWDLTTNGGVAVVNGAYVVILEAAGQVLRRRLFVARSP